MRRILCLFLFLSLFAASCGGPQSTENTSVAGGSGFPVTIGSVEIKERPSRIVSLSSTATESLFAIGAGKQVAAVDDQSNYPPDAPKTELSGFQPNVEAVAAKDPDLVVISYDPGQFTSALTALNIPVLMQTTAKSLDEAYGQIEDLGKATGNAADAEDVVDKMKADIRATTSGVPKTDATYYHELDDTYFSLTSKTFMGQIYSLFGLRNIADEADTTSSGSPQLSAEYIIKADPDLIFLADTKCCGQSYETVASRPGWSNITAVKDRVVIPLDDDIASRWGPRVVELLKTVASVLTTPEPAGY